MVSDLVFYPLALIALAWLLVLLQYAWPSRGGAGGHRAAKPITTTRKRSRDPKPFAGFPQKPHCEACEQTAESRPQASWAPPPPIVSTRGRRRQVETSDHFCPQAIWAYHGWVGFGNLRANGHPSGRRGRQFYCLGCKGYFQETHGTPFQGTHVEPDKLVWAIGALAEGLGLRAVARVFAVDPNTGLVWLVEAAEHLQAFSRYVLHNVPVAQVQLDELFALLSAVKEGEITAAKALKRLSRSPPWVWVAMEPVTKLVLTVDGGARTLTMAQWVVQHRVPVLAPDGMPLFLTDGFREYRAALVTHYGQWVQSERSQAKGPMPKPRWLPRPGLLSAQVIKTVCRRRLVRVHHRVVFGTLAAVNAGLAKHGWQINPSFIEPLKLDFRQPVAAIGRRVNTWCKQAAGLRQQVALFQVYHTFGLPHASLRQPLPQPEPTNGTGSAKQWRPCTPAMAAGLTHHVWSLRDVLLYRVPPWPQPQAFYRERPG